MHIPFICIRFFGPFPYVCIENFSGYKHSQILDESSENRNKKEGKLNQWPLCPFKNWGLRLEPVQYSMYLVETSPKRVLLKSGRMNVFFLFIYAFSSPSAVVFLSSFVIRTVLKNYTLYTHQYKYATYTSFGVCTIHLSHLTFHFFSNSAFGLVARWSYSKAVQELKKYRKCQQLISFWKLLVIWRSWVHSSPFHEQTLDFSCYKHTYGNTYGQKALYSLCDRI